MGVSSRNARQPDSAPRQNYCALKIAYTPMGYNASCLATVRRREDILAFFDHHTSNGPTEAINGRLEALRRNALGFRNHTHYRWRSLLHSGALHSLVNAL